MAYRLLVAVGEGRLDLNEYDERVQRAYAAKTYMELVPLTSDLPQPAPPPMPAPPVYRQVSLPPVLPILVVAVVLMMAAGFAGSFLLIGVVVWALVNASRRRGARY